MAINLTALQPHKVSRDLSGYITYIYGPPKVGKTTLGSQMPKPLILAFERGYNALGGVYAQDITTWAEMKQVVRELKKPEVKDMFSTLVVDTVDLAAVCCEKYVCAQAGVDTISQVPYGQGWGLLKREFEDVFRTVTQMGYAVYFVSHAKEGVYKKQDGTEYTIVRPSVPNTYNAIVENMVDIYGYMHPVVENGESTIKISLRSSDGSVSCGGRFKKIAPEIDASYEALVKALNDAIDAEAQVKGSEFVTDKRESTATQSYDFDTYYARANEIITKLIENNPNFKDEYAPKIEHIIENYLGKGKKLAQCGRDQVEQVVLITGELEELMK